MFPRSSGLLLHATSLPGGRLGPEAYRFVDFLAAAGQRWWQLLPVGPPGPGRSPYAALSAFAGDEKLWGGGAPDAEPLDAPWVADYALFRALRDAQGAPWTKWPRALRDRQPAALARARRTHARRVARYTRLQGAFDAQWRALKRYANERGIGLIGDVPLFVAHDSADVWAHRDLYKLKANGAPQVVAGVPPDYFSERGQRWGNPVYRWDRIKHRRFAWWIARLRRGFELFDALRLDHFLGFLRTWEIPAHAKDARRGAWTKGPRAAFFRAVRRALGRRLLIAEDLGLRTAASDALRERFGLPGMRVLQFSFGPDPADRPHAFPRNCVVYTGTHDNDTTAGWARAGGADAQRALVYAGCRKADVAWGLLRTAWTSPPDLAIAPVQDVLGLPGRARMNTPGTARGNWRWQLRTKALTPQLARRLRALTEAAGR